MEKPTADVIACTVAKAAKKIATYRGQALKDRLRSMEADAPADLEVLPEMERCLERLA